MSVSKSSFLLMAGIGQESGSEFSFTESLHMQLREDKNVWISQDSFGFKTGLFPLYCKNSETTFDDAFVLAAAWAKAMIKKDDSFLKYVQAEFKNHPRRVCNPFVKETYIQAGEILRKLTPPLKFVAVSLYDSDDEFTSEKFLEKAKAYNVNFEFCKTLVKHNPIYSEKNAIQ